LDVMVSGDSSRIAEFEAKYPTPPPTFPKFPTPDSLI